MKKGAQGPEMEGSRSLSGALPAEGFVESRMLQARGAGMGCLNPKP